MIVIGIDPGKLGGISFMEESRDCTSFPLPINDEGRVDVGQLQELILETFHEVYMKGPYTDSWAVMWIEKQQMRGGQRGQFLIGENYGRLTATFDLIGIPVNHVHPKVWKKILPPMLEKENNKDVALRYCKDQGYEIPTLKPRGKILHDGIADAICVALYGWKEFETSK